jgi:hypothetical protein
VERVKYRLTLIVLAGSGWLKSTDFVRESG